MDYKCDFCGCDGNWNDGIISLELDHIDGDITNNELSNLRFLCPNCHALTNTYRGKNKVVKTNYEMKKNKKNNHIKEPKHCLDCGSIISTKALRCKSCAKKLQKRKIQERPTREILKQLIRQYSFIEIGAMHGVSNNTIKKWCKFYSLPYMKKDIKLYSNEEWCTI